MRRLLLTLLSCYAMGANAQKMTLELSHEMAIRHSTIYSQRTIQSDMAIANIKSAKSAYLPNAEINGHASYQSQVTAIPISIPGVDIPTIDKDQYRATIDLQQLVYDGGYVSRQKKLLESGLQIENIRLDISQAALKDRVSGIYLGILLIDENISITKLLVAELTNNIDKLKAMVAGGVALNSNVEKLEVERMKVSQRITELYANRNSLVEMLSSLIGEQIASQTVFEAPNISTANYSIESKRAEYRLFDAQKKSLVAQQSLVESKNLPKVLAFATGGYGRPGLNMLSNDFDTYYIVGARLSIPLTKWTSTKHEKQAIASKRNLIEEQRVEFERQNRAEIINSLGEIDKYKKLIATDKEIITKLREITSAEQEKLLNGVSTSNDYLSELNAENQAVMNQKLHEIQLLQAIINYKSLTGNN